MDVLKRLQAAESKVSRMETKRSNLEGQKEATLKGLKDDHNVKTLTAAENLLTKKKLILTETADSIDDQVELVEGLIEAIEETDDGD